MSDWIEKSLEEIADLSGGFAFRSEDYARFGRFILRTLNIRDDCSITKDNAVFLPEELCDQYSKFELKLGDTLFVMVGATIGKIGYIRENDLPALLNQNMWLIRARPGIADPRFIHYAFRYAAKPMLVLAAGSARDFFRRDDFRKLSIPVPPLDEQRAIAYVLGALDDKIELNRRMNETLEAMARALFKSWFVDFDPVRAKAEGRTPYGMDAETAALFPSAFEDSELGEIPQGWRVSKLEELLFLQRGFDLPATERKEGKYPVLSASGQTGTHNEFMVKGPGVTTGRSGLIGKVFFVHDDFWPLNTSLWVKEFRTATPTYAYHLIQRLDFESFNAGSAVPTLNRNHVHEISVIVPNKSIIEAYEEKALALFRKCRANEKEADSLAKLRDLLLPKLLSGELRVKDAEKRVAEVA